MIQVNVFTFKIKCRVLCYYSCVVLRLVDISFGIILEATEICLVLRG
jgi:hypothetical protein